MSQPRPQLTLSIDEKYSALWRKLTEHFEHRLGVLRALNDGDATDIETAKLRGRIGELKALLDLNIDRTE